MDRAEFSLASPVWAVGRESEMNLWLSFRAIASGAEKTVLRLTGSSAYNVKVGGEFVAFGPARYYVSDRGSERKTGSERVHGTIFNKSWYGPAGGNS